MLVQLCESRFEANQIKFWDEFLDGPIRSRVQNNEMATNSP